MRCPDPRLSLARLLIDRLDAGSEVADLGLRWSIGVRDGHLSVVDETPEATVEGSVTDLMLLVSRTDDADTLFCQRRLVLTGDTDQGTRV